MNTPSVVRLNRLALETVLDTVRANPKWIVAKLRQYHRLELTKDQIAERLLNDWTKNQYFGE